METLQIIEQLLNGNHLEPKELQEAENIVNRLNTEIESRKPAKIDFTRVNNDVNGNPRYVCHYLNIDSDYQTAIKKANTIGGKKFHNKQYGGGIVFSSYNLDNLTREIFELKNAK